MRSHRTTSIKKAGFTLIDCVISLSLMSILIAGLIGLLRDSDSLLHSEILDKSKKLNRTAFQEDVQHGFLKTQENFSLQQNDSTQ